MQLQYVPSTIKMGLPEAKPLTYYKTNCGEGWVMEWTVQGSNPGSGEILRTRPDRPWGPPSLLYNGYRVSPWGKAAGVWR
jgi:hypothetical protein